MAVVAKIEVTDIFNDDIKAINLSPVVKAFIAGSISGTISTVLFQPLDLVKTRLQSGQMSLLYGSVASGHPSSLTVMAQIIQKEQLAGLWKGMAPSVARCVPGVGLYFSSLQWLKGRFALDTKEPTAIQAIMLGVTARTISGVCLIPITVIKTRIESGQFGYNSVSNALVQIHRQEGLRGLTCGLLPTLFRDAPFSGLYLMFYTQLKSAVPQDLKRHEFQTPVHFTCGLLAGVLASVVTQPADVLKTKMQLNPNKFNSIFDAIVHVQQKYGVKGYFKGLGPRLLRRTLMAAMAWTLYEKITLSLGLK